MPKRKARNKKPPEPLLLNRPVPPDWKSDSNNPEPYRFAPAPEIYEWLQLTILNESSPMYNPDHEHLVGNNALAFMWAETTFHRHQMQVLAQAELVAIRDGGWRGLRQESQLEQWFGVENIPKAIITIAAPPARDLDDRSFCALIEHELYHLAHKHTHMGPCYDPEGRPVLVMRGHDVEEFFGVARRYGGTQQVCTLVKIAQSKPEMSQLNISQACGTCLLRSA